MEVLEPDSGIRLRARLRQDNHEKFIFITRSGDRYVINTADPVLEKSSGKEVPGGKEDWLFFGRCEEAWQALNNLIIIPKEAWLY
jgi:hypothetical protein